MNRAERLECSDSEGRNCVFADQSPLVIYQADDDTPGIPEIYAVKRGLLGKMTPIELNNQLEDGWEVACGGGLPRSPTVHVRYQAEVTLSGCHSGGAVWPGRS